MVENETPKTYRDILWYMYGFTDYERRGLAAYAPEFYNLDRVRRLLALLGDPQRSFQSIHIAGTKGKGSTAAIAEAVLRRAGYRTGLYTSPHLHTFRERIQTNGQLIPEEQVVALIQEMEPLLEQVEGITTFEVMTGLAFVWFARQNVEWAVVEVGLGGRLDATNVLLPAVAIITSISRDHTAILGETHAEIAAEKAGIIKPGVPVVSSPQHKDALSVIEDACRQAAVPLTLVGRDWTWEICDITVDRHAVGVQTFLVCHEQELVGKFRIPLLGSYQVVNATTAIAALALLRSDGVSIPMSAIENGLAQVQWPGRFEILGQAPYIVADSAHNGDSARKLIQALQRFLDFERLIVVLGASTDHVTPGLLQALLAQADRAIATKTRHPRAASPPWIRDQAANLGFEMETSPSVPQALDMALASTGLKDLICCTGSVFVAAEARMAWFARQGVTLPAADPA